MARYLDETAALADGISIAHQPDQTRYAVLRSGDPAAGETGEGTQGAELVGEAHYTLLGDDAINFDHTVVIPELRGTGISGLLAHRALTGSAAEGRRIQASCWFIAGYLAKHPELRRSPLS